MTWSKYHDEAGILSGLRGERLRHGDSFGAFMVEFAIVCSFLFFFLIIAFEMLRLCYVGLTVQFIATHALRQGVISEAAQSSIPARIADLGARYNVSIPADEVEVCELQESGTCSAPDGAVVKPGNFMVIRIAHPTSLLLFGTITLHGLAMGRNEPA